MRIQRKNLAKETENKGNILGKLINKENILEKLTKTGNKLKKSFEKAWNKGRSALAVLGVAGAMVACEKKEIPEVKKDATWDRLPTLADTLRFDKKNITLKEALEEIQKQNLVELSDGSPFEFSKETRFNDDTTAVFGELKNHTAPDTAFRVAVRRKIEETKKDTTETKEPEKAKAVFEFLRKKWDEVKPNHNGYIAGMVDGIGNYNEKDSVLVEKDPNTGSYGLKLKDGTLIMADDFGRIYALFIEAALKYDPVILKDSLPANTFEDYFGSLKGIKNTDGEWEHSLDRPTHFKTSFYGTMAKILNGDYKNGDFVAEKIKDWVVANEWLE